MAFAGAKGKCSQQLFNPLSDSVYTNFWQLLSGSLLLFALELKKAERNTYI